MKEEIEDLPKSKIKIKISLSGEEFSPYLVMGARELSKEIDIPGFRRGKAPQKIVEERIGKERITEEAVNIALNKIFPKIVEEKKLKIIGPPQAKIDFPLLKEKGDFSAEIEASVFPEVLLPDWRKIVKEEEKKDVNVKDEEIENALLWIQKSRAKKIRKITKVKRGDEVLLDYEIRIGNVKIENGDIKNQRIVVGDGKLLLDFEEKLVGMKEGEEKSFSVICPEKFWKKELQGKSLDFKVKMKEVFKIELPEINDEFAMSLGEVKSVKELKENIKKGILIEKREAEERRWQGEVLQKIANEAKIEVPDILIEEQRERMINDLKNAVEEQMDISFESYLSQIKKTEDDIKKEFMGEAEKRVRIFLCIYKISSEEKIEVTDEETESEIQKNMQRYPQIMENLKNKQGDKEFKNYIREKIIEKKVIKLINEVRDQR